MGFYSWDCKVCGHPLLSSYALADKNKWMNEAVVLFKDGGIVTGEYDGYGRLDGEHGEEEIDGDPECYHAACYKLAGKPTEFTEKSRSAGDQGYFFEDKVHNFL